MKTIVDLAQDLIKPYIGSEDKKYAANVAPVETSPATSAHTAGTQIIYNGVLYDVTADIAANDVLATTGEGANIAAADDVSEQISNVKQALSNEINYDANTGVKNVYPCDLEKIKSLNTAGTWSGNVFTHNNGITFTVGSDGIITANGMSTGGIYFTLEDFALSAGKYILNGAPSGSGESSYYEGIWIGSGLTYYDYGSGVEFTNANDITNAHITIRIQSGQTLSNKQFKVMVCDARITDRTFASYAKPNTELTKDIKGLTDNQFKNGCVNLFKVTLSSGVQNEVAYVVNADKTVSVSVTQQATSQLIIGLGQFTFKAGKRYRLSGCPSGAGSTTYGLYTGGAFDKEDRGNGIELVSNVDVTTTISILIHKNCPVVNNVVFKPMITLADQPNSDYAHYVPYAKSNKELTDAIEAHTIGTRVDISSYTSANYYPTSEGYLFLYNDTGKDGQIIIGDSLNVSIGGVAGRFALYVRKGTAVRVVGTPTLATFAPLS